MTELQYNLIGITIVSALLVWNRRVNTKRYMSARVSRALRMWVRHGEVYFNWNPEGYGR